jgi:hypothetical protein
MNTYKYEIRTSTKFGDCYTNIVEYSAKSWKQGYEKAKRFALSAHGYENITAIQVKAVVK